MGREFDSVDSVEVAAMPEQVWQAIATGPGIDSWFMGRNEVDELQRGRPLPPTRWSTATLPALVADGGRSPAWMRNGCRALADVLPNAAYRTIPGQTHLVKPKALAPVLREFFAA